MDLKELRERQSWTLHQKIDHSLGVIDQFISRLDGKVYVGFSGGKDSTVLLDLCRKIKPDIKAVFCNTGNEYPDICRFVRELKNTEGYNIEIIYPKIKPKQVMEKYGFPLVSKDISNAVGCVRHTHSQSVINRRIYGLSKDGTKKSTNVGTISKKWLFLLQEPYEVSASCCSKLKKEPFRKYESDNGVYPILGTMASESLMRQIMYIQGGGVTSLVM